MEKILEWHGEFKLNPIILEDYHETILKCLPELPAQSFSYKIYAKTPEHAIGLIAEAFEELGPEPLVIHRL